MHRGAHTAREGWRHIGLFTRSGLKFFGRPLALGLTRRPA